MKRRIVMLLSVVVLLTGSLSAQNEKDAKSRPAKRPDFAEMQLKQVLDALMLDDKTAAEFTPVYKDYQKEMKDCRLPRMKKRGTEMTDDEIAKEIESEFAQGRKVIDVKEKYYKKFKKILTMKQIRKIYSLERSNMRRLGWEMNRRQGHKAPPMPRMHKGERMAPGK